MIGPRCVPMMSPTSFCLALNAQVDTGGLLPMPGMASVFPNHCVSFELTLPAAIAVNSLADFGFLCLICAATRVISSAGMVRTSL